MSSAMSASLALHQRQLGHRRAEQLAAPSRAPSASSSARRAKPSAAAPTVERKTSSVPMRDAHTVAGRGRSASIRRRARRSAARERVRRDHVDAARRPRALRPRPARGTLTGPWRPEPRRCARRRRRSPRSRRWRSRSSRRRAGRIPGLRGRHRLGDVEPDFGSESAKAAMASPVARLAAASFSLLVVPKSEIGPRRALACAKAKSASPS